MSPDELDELMYDAAEMVNQSWADSPRLTAFGNATAKLAAIQREQVAQLQAEGVTDEDLKAWEKARNKPASTPRTTLTVEKVRGWLERALDKAQSAEEKAVRLQAALDARDAERGKFDHGMLQVSLKQRQRGQVGEMRDFRELQEAKARADHYRHVARKHAAWIEKHEDAA